MAERENPFTVMKRYLTSMNKRIDELASKTNTLDEDIKRHSEQNTSERARLSERFDSEKAEVNSKLEELTSKVEGHQSQLMQAVEQLKQHLEEIKSSSASREDVQAMQSSLKDEIATLREQKLERTEFHDFMEKNNASIKEVFEELTPGESFADFASTRASSQPTPTPVVEEMITPTETTTQSSEPESEPVEKEQPPTERFSPEQRREEKRKKKWL